ncbi:MAG: AAA family ATPase [Methanomassiliicoccus sp.]|nr:AAA family ATPase [Methanomassiliicoccus sp.]
MMKIIATGKGGVGKTTIVSTLSRLLAKGGKKVLVFDTDPSMNLAMTLGIPFRDIATLTEDKAAISEELDGCHDEELDIDEIIAEHSADTVDGVKVVIMGTIPSGGSGCLCSPISLVKVIIQSLSDEPRGYDIVIVDSQAGPEILGRGLATCFDCNLVVTEAMPKAMEVTRQVLRLSNDLQISRSLLVLNKLENEADLDMVRRELKLDRKDIVTIRSDDAVRKADRNCTSILDDAPSSLVVKDIESLINVMMSG